jgi:NAD(P)-dependent dehydrogenase (short-subunit alcohol dehydrogenase family)
LKASYDFSGHRAIVTGAGRGIGLAIANSLRASGADVVGWDVEPSQDSASGALVRADVTDFAAVERALRETVDRHGPPDILVNNAGYAGPTLALDAYDPAEWRRIVDVNLVGTFHVCRSVVPAMRGSGWDAPADYRPALGAGPAHTERNVTCVKSSCRDSAAPRCSSSSTSRSRRRVRARCWSSSPSPASLAATSTSVKARTARAIR